MVMSQELAYRFLVTDTIRQTLVSRRSDRGGHNSGIEIWKLMREVGDMKKSLKTVTGLSQRGFDQLAREQRVYARGRSSGHRLTKVRPGTSSLWLQPFAARHRTVR